MNVKIKLHITDIQNDFEETYSNLIKNIIDDIVNSMYELDDYCEYEEEEEE